MKFCMGVLNLDVYMEKNMRKSFEVIISKSPFAQSKVCLSGKAQKNICSNFERYNLTIGKDPTVDFFFGSTDYT